MTLIRAMARSTVHSRSANGEPDITASIGSTLRALLHSILNAARKLPSADAGMGIVSMAQIVISDVVSLRDR